MSARANRLGRWGETAAAHYLAEHGYTLLDQNARTKYGELDLVVFKVEGQSPVIVFVEVKTRASASLGPPEISVTPAKQQRLLAAAQAYLQAHPDLPHDWRVDVIAISCASIDDAPEILHFENALTAS